LLIQNKRENYLGSIFRRFFSDYKEYKGVKTAMITTAIQIDKSTYERIKQLLSNLFKSEIELNVNIDSSIIGGYILRIEDMQYDASVETSLKRMKRSLITVN
jgi:F-type H+-transporting ATPase subunit delta